MCSCDLQLNHTVNRETEARAQQERDVGVTERAPPRPAKWFFARTSSGLLLPLERLFFFGGVNAICPIELG